jgi:hypothetical protein
VTDYKYTDSFSPDSTLISVAYYHRGEQNLFVKFGGNGIYGYAKVPSWVWDAFAKASSAGNYYNTNIKAKFTTFNDVTALTFIGGGKAASESNTHKFVLVGHSPVEYTFEGTSLEDAKADFARLFPQGVLKEVRVHFE